ncbi:MULTISPECIES: helix-turn-helix domain-containing protein [Mucilaginibacter]|uniref:Helix-turn-helix transcriptional regulator n=1 Tax=Mucilaginibacter ginsenosidivorax TaxID=862126 RepID=A0A5B8VTB2_9SPHI|nr:helix-turn-helix transcriptional regulator [Mucilaginibacter ginsenosidivorax]
MANRNVEANKIIGIRLRDERKSKGISQENLWAISGITTSQIREIEKGRGDPRLSTMVELAKALNVSIDVLLPPSTYLNKAG